MTEYALEFNNILAFLIKNAQISESELARKTKVPRATINRLVLGKTPDPRGSTLNAIAEYFNVTVDQLLGKQPLFVDENKNIVTNTQISIPIIHWNESNDWEKIIKQLKPDNHFDWITIDPSIDQAKFAVKIHGESMWPQFQSNTILIICPFKQEKNKDFVVAYIKKTDEIVFRQLIIEDKYKFLKAINNIFPTIQFKETDKIIGVVIQTRNHYS